MSLEEYRSANGYLVKVTVNYIIDENTKMAIKRALLPGELAQILGTQIHGVQRISPDIHYHDGG
jgi:hypothetical protein